MFLFSIPLYYHIWNEIKEAEKKEEEIEKIEKIEK